MVLLDTHHHLDFLGPRTREAFLRAAAERGIGVVAQTLTPSSFLAATERGVGDAPEPLWSLGFHPWQLTDADEVDHELGVFADAIGQTRFVGEIGLDFFPQRLEESPRERQLEVLERVLALSCESAAGRDEPVVLSIHAVRSIDLVLDLLERLDAGAAGVVPVLHFFGGTSDELTRAMGLGAYLSAHPHLLETKKGRAYLGQIPADRLLLESDLPGESAVEADDPASAGVAHADELGALLRDTVAALSEIRGEDVAPQLAETQARLYGIA